MITLTPADCYQLMGSAMEQAQQCAVSEDVPVGALIIDEQGAVIAQGWNTRERDADPLGHAEINVIAEASRKLESWRLEGCTLIVTLEPCVMCAGAITTARIPRVIFGAWDDKAGAGGSVIDLLRNNQLHHSVEVISGVRAEECAELLTRFFRDR